MRVLVGMATIEGREKTAAAVVDSLLGQGADVAVVHNYPVTPYALHGGAPRRAWVSVDERCLMIESHSNLGDQAKFLPFVEEVREAPWDFYMAVDDDLILPDDYVATLTRWCAELDAPVGVHGVNLRDGRWRGYARSRDVLGIGKALAKPLPVDILGTGTACWRPRHLGLRAEDFGAKNMADIWFAIALSRARIARFAIPRSRTWVGVHPYKRTIWDESQRRTGSDLDNSAVLEATLREHRDLIREARGVIEAAHAQGITSP